MKLIIFTSIVIKVCIRTSISILRALAAWVVPESFCHKDTPQEVQGN